MSVDKTWDTWQDALGNTFQAGDIVAIAVINGKSPQMVIAEVIRINKVNSRGEPHMTNKWFDFDEPIEEDRVCRVKDSKDPYYSRYYADHICKRECTVYVRTGESRKVPSCSVTAKPLIDARGFIRYGKTADGENRPATYSIPENILLVEKRS